MNFKELKETYAKKTYIGAVVVGVGGIAGFFNYTLSHMLISIGFAIIFIGLRHALEKKN